MVVYLFIMENNKVLFIKADNDKIINTKCIKWVKKMNDCLEICTKSNGCSINGNDTHKLCKNVNPNSYKKLEKIFE